ncbi:MAG: spore coat-associated protein [Solirubrobacteraceae bacterium]|jgi:uncharacterized membrane protein YgcG|nr:spore coat-associated protein [Solirubrobacteraceae bacterium]
MRTSKSRATGLATRVVASAIVCALVGMAVAYASSTNLVGAADQQQSGPQAAVRAAGTFGQTNSKNGQPILTVAGMKPGASAIGTVTLTNSGTVAGDFTLSSSNLAQTKGLAGQLDLLVQDITNAGAPVAVYVGKLGAMPSQPLGTFAAGSAHTYRFTVTLPLATGNAFQNATASIEYDWSSTGDDTTGGGSTGGGSTGGGTTGGGSTGGGTTGGGTDNSAPPAQPDPGTSTGSNLPGGTQGALLSLSGAKQKLSDGVNIMAVCTKACIVTLTGSVKVQGVKKAFSLTKITGSIRAGVRTKAKLKFSKQARSTIKKALARRKRVTVTIVGTVKGGTKTQRLTVQVVK